MDLRNLKLQKKFDSFLPYEDIERTYIALVQRLNKGLPKETTKTLKEDLVHGLILKATKMKVLRSIWIKKRNIDLFIPGIYGSSKIIGTSSFKGLAIEVDGEVHNLQAKMNRDNSKYVQLHQLGIALYTIENQDLHQPSFKAFLNHLPGLPQLDTRGRKRVMRNIYLSTLAAHQKDFPLDQYLLSHQIELIEEVRGLL